jgi:predicted transcriptional regulator
MGALSLKLPDELLEASGQCAEALRLSRAEYIRRAIVRMNRETRTRLRAKRLTEVSRKVRKESMRVNSEFAAIEQDPDA